LFIGADNLGHLGGLAAGAVFGFLVPTEQDQDARLAILWRGLAVVCLLAWGYTVFMMVHSISQGVGPETFGSAALSSPSPIAPGWVAC
jgi:hypothetical protein